MTEARTNGERYASACTTSDLRLRDTGGSEVQIVIAAGLVEDGLATALYRLTVEYDAQRGPIDEARRWVAARMEYANHLRNESKLEASRVGESDPERVIALEDEADEAQRSALAGLKTEILLAMAAMQTLREARRLVKEFAIDLAGQKRSDLRARQHSSPTTPLSYETVGLIAERVVEVFLEPHCHHCDGRGFTGGGRHEHSGPQMLCKPCRGTGSRRVDIGRSPPERLFASHLIMSMDAQMYEVQRAIGRNRRSVEEAKTLIARAQGRG